MLELEGVKWIRGGHVALDLPALSVARGEVMAVIGPNGAGKSSLLQAIGLLSGASFKRYCFDGRQAILPADTLMLRRQMAMVFQEPLLLDTTVLANASMGLRLRGTAKAEANRRTSAWLDRLGVGPLASRPAYQLSGGEAQRVSLARALAIAPKLLLLDEPFTSLDVLTRSWLLKELRPLLKGAQTTALLVTHDVTEVAQLADSVIVLEQGHLIQAGKLAAILSAPQTPIVQQMATMVADMAAALTPLSLVQSAAEIERKG